MRFNKGPSAGQGMGWGMGRGGQRNRFRDGSCLGSGQGRGAGRGLGEGGESQPVSSSGRGFFCRFPGDPNEAGSPARSTLDWIRSAFNDLQRQIDALRNPSAK